MKKQKWIVKFINKVDLPWGLSKEQLEEMRKEVEQLTSENARLTEQFESSKPLPCKVGDWCIYANKVARVQQAIITDTDYIITLNSEGHLADIYEYDIKIFVAAKFYKTKPEAEAKLKELQKKELKEILEVE